MNSVTLVIDGLQAGLLGAYGNTWVRTPQLDRLAAGSYLFDQAFTTDPSNSGELWAGRLPHWPPPDHLPDTPWFRLTRHDVRTAVITDDPAVVEFVRTDVAECVLLPTEPVRRSAPRTEDTGFFRLLDTAAEWLAAARGPFALWIQARGLFGPWDAPYNLRAQFADVEDPPPPDFVTPPLKRITAGADPDELWGIRQAYAGQVALMDTCVGALVDQVGASPAATETLTVFAGRRGFPLGEHGQVGWDAPAYYNEYVHVPLCIRPPARDLTGPRSAALVTLADLTPTLLEWHGLSLDGSHGGLSLWPIVRGATRQLRDRLVFGDPRSVHALRTPAWHYVAIPDDDGLRPELYTKPDDWLEVNDVSDRCADIAEELEQTYHATAGDQPEQIPPLPLRLVEPTD